MFVKPSRFSSARWFRPLHCQGQPPSRNPFVHEDHDKYSHNAAFCIIYMFFQQTKLLQLAITKLLFKHFSFGTLIFEKSIAKEFSNKLVMFFVLEGFSGANCITSASSSSSLNSGTDFLTGGRKPPSQPSRMFGTQTLPWPP